mmetsp:Transcript_62903/g.187154  ORF Transcript_62903/g.187154 Transcript_62903/m.187154 type:complete len:192 (+) Transcript_62903:320-895(+)
MPHMQSCGHRRSSEPVAPMRHTGAPLKVDPSASAAAAAAAQPTTAAAVVAYEVAKKLVAEQRAALRHAAESQLRFGTGGEIDDVQSVQGQELERRAHASFMLVLGVKERPSIKERRPSIDERLTAQTLSQRLSGREGQRSEWDADALCCASTAPQTSSEAQEPRPTCSTDSVSPSSRTPIADRWDDQDLCA